MHGQCISAKRLLQGTFYDSCVVCTLPCWNSDLRSNPHSSPLHWHHSSSRCCRRACEVMRSGRVHPLAYILKTPTFWSQSRAPAVRWRWDVYRYSTRKAGRLLKEAKIRYTLGSNGWGAPGKNQVTRVIPVFSAHHVFRVLCGLFIN